MSWSQKNFTLPARSRGSYLITDHVLSELPEIRDYKVGMLNLFVQHTSCALSLNENWDDDVRTDMSDALDRIAPYDKKGNLYRHSAEGEDDMPVCLIPFHSLYAFQSSLFQSLLFFFSFILPSSLSLSFPLFRAGVLLTSPGSYQIRSRGRLGEHPHLQWPFGDRHLAGYLVSGVPHKPPLAQGGCDHSGPEVVTRSRCAREFMTG